MSGNLTQRAGIDDVIARCVQTWVDNAHSAEMKQLYAFEARFHALCEEKGIVGERLHDLTRSVLDYKARSVGRIAQGAYNPTGNRDVRHLSTSRCGKHRKLLRATMYEDSHAYHMDLHVRMSAYMSALERQFCTSKDRWHKRRLRQMGRWMSHDTHLALPVVFGGTKWYDVRFRRP